MVWFCGCELPAGFEFGQGRRFGGSALEAGLGGGRLSEADNIRFYYIQHGAMITPPASN